MAFCACLVEWNHSAFDLPALSGPPAMRESGGYDRPDAAVGA